MTKIDQCPVCRSERLQVGVLGHYPHTFLLKEQWREPQYKSHGFVCLNCGFLGHYLPQEELDKLQAALGNADS